MTHKDQPSAVAALLENEPLYPCLVPSWPEYEIEVLNEDIFLLKQIRVTLDATKISIVDARSRLNAKANQMAGKGYEDVNEIGRDVATLGFMGIENIHYVRDSLAAFCSAAQTPGQEFYHAVGASGWLRHLSQIMKSAAFVVDELQRGVAVLVHCSDGWDRTAQLTGLAQLCLDPYYRTLEGFEVLVEKEWCSFGHMFGLRVHSDSPTESSPVFLQWLDAVWQVMRQYPSSFEFTGHYLERLVEGVYSAAFLNFAGNCERERRERLRDLKAAGGGAVSLFSYLREHILEGHIMAPMVNPLYRPSGHGLGGGKGGGGRAVRIVDVLRPCCELQGLEPWRAVYMRDCLIVHHREKQLSVEQGLRLQVTNLKAAYAVAARRQTASLVALALVSLVCTAAVAVMRDYGLDGDRELRSFAGGLAFSILPVLLLWAVPPSAFAPRAFAQLNPAGWGGWEVYELRRRLDLVDAHVDRLPRGPQKQLQASAAAFSSSDWDNHRRLAEQAMADVRDAVAASAAAAANADAVSSRGRSATRIARSSTPGEDPSRSRSRSFSFGLRRLGAGGERSQLLASHDSLQFRGREGTDAEELEEVLEEERPADASGVPNADNAAEQIALTDALERPSRSKSLFGLGGRGAGGRRRTSVVEQNIGGAGGVGSTESGNSRGVGYGKGLFASGRGQMSSTPEVVAEQGDHDVDVDADVGGGGVSRAFRFASFSFERANSVPPAEGSACGGATKSGVTLDPEDATITSQGRATRPHPTNKSSGGIDPRRMRPENGPQSARHSSRKGWDHGGLAPPETTEIDEEDTGARRPRAASTSAMISGRESRPTGVASNDEEGPAEAFREAAGGGGSRRKGSKWSFFRKDRTTPGAADDESVKKGLLSSLQRSLSIPQRMSSPKPTVLRRATSDRATATATATVSVSVSVGAAAAAATTMESVRKVDEGAASGAERPGAAASIDKLRQMQHTIATLEVELIVKDIIDDACLQAAGRARERASETRNALCVEVPAREKRPAPLSGSSARTPAFGSPPSTTARKAERQAFFGVRVPWGNGVSVDLASREDEGGGRGDGDTATHRQYSSAVADKRKQREGSRAAWTAPARSDARPGAYATRGEGQGSSAPLPDKDGGRKGDPAQEEGEEDGNFFQALRRKLFEGDKQPDREEVQKAAKNEGKVAATARGEGVRAAEAAWKARVSEKSADPPKATGSRPGMLQEASPKFMPVKMALEKSGSSAPSSGSGLKQSGVKSKASPQQGRVTPPLNSNNPDAGAGATRPAGECSGSTSTPRAQQMASLKPEEAAAKFGLVRMSGTVMHEAAHVKNSTGERVGKGVGTGVRYE